jgi:hypothetical protein
MVDRGDTEPASLPVNGISIDVALDGLSEQHRRRNEFQSDEEAIRLAVKTVVRVKPQDCKIVRIHNTLELVDIQVSEPLMAQVSASPEMFEIMGQPAPLRFGTSGILDPMVAKRH